MDDAALVERARRGDRDAFSDLVNRYQDELYTMALRMLGEPQSAADVVQEAFLKAYLNLGKLHGSVRAWLYRVAINAAHDVQRQRQRRPTAPLEDQDGLIIDLPDPGAGPEQRAEARERTAVVRTALLQLPEDFRAVVVLRDVNELSYEEMADALGIAVGTVKSRLSRGRRQLADLLRGSIVAPAVSEEA